MRRDVYNGAAGGKTLADGHHARGSGTPRGVFPVIDVMLLVSVVIIDRGRIDRCTRELEDRLRRIAQERIDGIGRRLQRLRLDRIV